MSCRGSPSPPRSHRRRRPPRSLITSHFNYSHSKLASAHLHRHTAASKPLPSTRTRASENVKPSWALQAGTVNLSALHCLVYFLGTAPFNQFLQLNSGSLLNTASSIRFHLDLIYNTDGTVRAAPRATMWLLTAFRGRILVYPPRWLTLLLLTIRSHYWGNSGTFPLTGFIVAITSPLTDSAVAWSKWVLFLSCGQVIKKSN